MWISTMGWLVGWIVCGGFGFYLAQGPGAVPDRAVETVLILGCIGSCAGGLLGAFRAMRSQTDEELRAIAEPMGTGSRGDWESLSGQEKLSRMLPSLAMGCSAILAGPAFFGWALDFIRSEHLLAIASLGTCGAAWIATGNRRMPAGVAFILLGWITVVTVVITANLQVSYQHQAKYTVATLAFTLLGLSILRKMITVYFPSREPVDTAYP